MSDEQVEPDAELSAEPESGPAAEHNTEHNAGIDHDLLARAREAAAGHPGLEDALSRLEALDEVDIDQHPAEFDAIHRALRAALTDAGQVPDGP
jgi:hypothetical protein